jgi:hypothetical protein
VAKDQSVNFLFFFHIKSGILMAAMRDTDQPNSDASPPEAFPDLVTCRVTDAGFAGYLDCLNIWASHCPHALCFGSGYFCRHPTAPEILARSEVKKA